MARVAVVTDSTADLPDELTERNDIHVVPLNVRIDGHSYEDRVTISPEEFMRQLTTSGSFPRTSQPSVGRFEHEYQRLAEQYDQIISIHISSKLSGTYQSACMARDLIDSPADIRVVDSRTTSMGLGFTVLRAAELASDETPVPEIERQILSILPRTHVVFLVDTLEYLRRGGRIGRAAEVVGSILKLKPILRIEEGIVVPHARTRTRARAIRGLVELVGEIPRAQRIALLYTAGCDDLDEVVERLRPMAGGEAIIKTELSPALSAHIGPNGLGVAVLEGEPASDD